MNIHGHTHDAPGRVKIGNILVLNPGALMLVVCMLVWFPDCTGMGIRQGNTNFLASFRALIQLTLLYCE